MSIQALRERLQASNKSANHLLAEQGSATWSAEKQTEFDNLAGESERTQRQIEAHEKMIAKDRDESFSDSDNFRTKDKSQGKKAFDTYLRKSFAQMSGEERTSVMNVMSTTTGSEGGFTVQSEVASTLVDMLKSYGFMRAVSGQVTTAQGNPLSYPTSDGTTEIGEFIAQNVAATALDPAFGSVSLNVFKASSKVIAVPFELLQDSQIDIEAMVLARAAQRIGRLTNIAFTTGAGVTDPRGMVTASSVGKVGATGQTTTILYDDLVDLVDSLDIAYLGAPAAVAGLAAAEPGFMLSQSMRRVLRKIKDTSGRPLWMPSYEEGLTGASPDRLLGFPVYLNNDMAAPAANARSLAFGNFSKYMIRDAMDVTIFRFDDSPFVRLGQIGFLAWSRVGGNLLDVNSIRMYQHSAT